MKAILVLDKMPKGCAYCKYYTPHTCLLSYEDTSLYAENRSVFCPLKPMPEKKHAHTFHYVDSKGDLLQGEMYEDYDAGWNDCIDKILYGGKKL